MCNMHLLSVYLVPTHTPHKSTRIQRGLEARHTPGRALVVRGAGSRACVCVPCRECRERRDHIISQSQQKRQAREDKRGQGVVYT